MFTLVISLVVVLGAVTAVTVLVFREIAQPAMDDADPHRATPGPPDASRRPPPAPGVEPPPDAAATPVAVPAPVAAPAPAPVASPAPGGLAPRFELRTIVPRRMVVAAPVKTSLGRRIRSALALAGLLTALGVGAAVMIGAIVVGVLFVARQALG